MKEMNGNSIDRKGKAAVDNKIIVKKHCLVFTAINHIRKKWLLEIFRVVKKGGYLVIGGPNKNFPIDTHGPDTRASMLEWWLYRITGLSIHKVWGDHFLWSYNDVRRYLHGLEYDMKALSIKKYYRDYNHVPPIIRPLFKLYLK